MTMKYTALDDKGRAAMEAFITEPWGPHVAFGPGWSDFLAGAWGRAITDQERGCIAAAIVYRVQKALEDEGRADQRIIGPTRGPNADPRLCAAADALEME